MRTPRPWLTGSVARMGAASLLCVVLAAGTHLSVLAQQPVPAQAAASKPSGRAAGNAARSETRPAWSELTAAQQQALKPLSGQWNTLSEAQKRKWIAMSRDFRTLPPEGQAKLHSRMNEWVSLSPQQRTQAR